MLKKGKSEKGFSLMEIIISIATIAIISTFVLQIFFVSSNANQRAQNMDYASIMAQSAIESVKGMGYEQIGDAKQIADAMGYKNYLNELKDGAITLSVGFDKDWNATDSLEGARFILSLRLTPVPSGNEAKSVVTNFTVKSKMSDLAETGRIYELSCDVIDTREEGEKASLILYLTNKYYAR